MTALPVTIVGKPVPGSDAAIARLFVAWLERQHAGTSWQLKPEGSSEGDQR